MDRVHRWPLAGVMPLPPNWRVLGISASSRKQEVSGGLLASPQVGEDLQFNTLLFS